MGKMSPPEVVSNFLHRTAPLGHDMSISYSPSLKAAYTVGTIIGHTRRSQHHTKTSAA